MIHEQIHRNDSSTPTGLRNVAQLYQSRTTLIVQQQFVYSLRGENAAQLSAGRAAAALFNRLRRMKVDKER